MNNNNLHVTLIVPTYNRADFLVQSLPDLLSQTRPPDRVIVVDDGSSDDTMGVVAKFGSAVEYIRQDNSGKSVALNRALSVVNDGLVWIFDDDDVPEVDALERLIAPFGRDPHLDFTFGLHDRLVSIDGKWQRRPVLDANPRGEPVKIASLKECYINQPSMLVARRFYQEVGPFNEEMLRAQDYEMLLRLSRTGKNEKIDGKVYLQRLHAADRGPKKEVALASNSSLNWLKYDRLIFKRVYDTYRLEDYVAGEMDELLAVATRMSAMARRGLWDCSAIDCAIINDIVSRTPQARISDTFLYRISTIFDWGGHGLTTVDEGEDFFREIGRLPSNIRFQLRRALIRPLFRRLRPPLRQRNKAQVGRVFRAFRNSALS